MSTLETLLDGEPEVEEIVVEESTEETTEEPTGEKQEVEASESDKPDETESSPEPDKETEASPELDGVHKELSRVRTLNRELKEQLAAKPQEEKALTDPFEDTQKFTNDVKELVSAEVLNVRLELTEQFARDKHGDEAVDSAIDWFTEAAKESPLILKKFHDSGNNIAEVVSLHSKSLEAAKMDDLPAYKESLRAEVRAEVEAELKGKLEKDKSLKDSIPESLVGTDSKGGLKSTDYSGPTSLESLIG